MPPRKPISEAIAYLLTFFGASFVLLGMIVFIPEVYANNHWLGVIYTGIVMLLLGAILRRY